MDGPAWVVIVSVTSAERLSLPPTEVTEIVPLYTPAGNPAAAMLTVSTAGEVPELLDTSNQLPPVKVRADTVNATPPPELPTPIVWAGGAPPLVALLNDKLVVLNDGVATA